jgi:hypothetical protein
MSGVTRLVWGSANGAMDELQIFSVVYILLAAVFTCRARAAIVRLICHTIRSEEAGS